MNFNGKNYASFEKAFENNFGQRDIFGSKGLNNIPKRKNKTSSIDEVMEVINDGDIIS